MKKILVGKKRILLIYLAIIVSTFLIASYYYFLNNYQKLEISNNTKYIQYLITKIDSNPQAAINESDMINFFDTVIYLKSAPIKSEKSIKYSTKNLQDIYVTTIKTDLLINYIEYFDIKNNYLFTIKTSNQREVVNTGKKTIFIFMAIVFIFLLIVFIMIRKYLHTIKVNSDELEHKVEERTSQIQSALAELEKANLKLYDMAHTDFLTKIRNRRNFFIHAENIFANAKRKNRDVSIIMIDIDNFKSFNDNYGHDLGDKVLVYFTKCVEKCLDSKDIFGRLGGEEFGIILDDTSLNEANDKAEFIRNEIEKIEIESNKKILNVTASFGVCDKRGCKDLDQMIQKSDSMLYSAKHSGKNKVRSRLG